MAAGVNVTTRTPWGYACSVSDGTEATNTVVLDKGNVVNLTGVFIAGNATTDICTLYDGSDNVLVMAAGGTKYASSTYIPFFNARVDGLKFATAGTTTTGLMSIFIE